MGASGSLLWLEGRSFTSAGALAASDYSINDSGETSYTQKISTVTLGSTAKTEDFYIGINYQNSTDTVKSATGTLFFDLPQFEQGSVVTPWRNAPADDDPIVWNLRYTPTANISLTTCNYTTPIDQRDLAGNLFLPWDGVLNYASSGHGSINAGQATGSVRTNGILDGANIAPAGFGNADTFFGTNTLGYHSQLTFVYPVSTTAGKHRVGLGACTTGGTATLEYSPPLLLQITATRGKFDLAEEYSVNDQSIEAGDVVSLADGSTTTIGKVTKAYDQSIFGIVSTAPGITLGSQVELNSYQEHRNLRPVPLSGRVPVKVTNENGPIKRGDILTSSATRPGFAMKATKAGRSIGIAMEDFDGAEGKILTFVNLSFYDPQVYITDSGILSLVKLPSQPVALTDNNGTVQIQSTYQVQNTQTKEVVERTGAFNDLFVANLKVGNLDTSFLKSELIDGLQTKIATLSGRLDLLEKQSSISAVLSSSTINASSSATFEELIIGKKLVTTDLGITGNISSGLLAISGLDSALNASTLNTLSGDLYLQNQLLGGINILNGRILIDKDGNMKLQNNLTAKVGEFDQIKINDSAGHGTITAGNLSIDIPTTVIGSNSKILVTPSTETGGQVLIVKERTVGTGFKVIIEKSYSADINFDWLVIN